MDDLDKPASELGIKGVVQTIYCPGASTKSTPVPALVEIRQFYLGSIPFHTQDVYRESYVACPRLCLYPHQEMPGRPLARCFEGKKYDPDNQRQFEKAKPCPYFRPTEDRERELVKRIEDAKFEELRAKWRARDEKREQREKEKRERLYEDGLIDAIFKAAFPKYYHILARENAEGDKPSASQ